jgi:hypothetical protein
VKKLLAISVLLNLAFVVGMGLSWKELIAHAGGGGGGVPVGNGDVNGDGRIDISDAVYTLTWLFAGGPGPVVIECPAAAGKGLPDTGQTKCYGIVEGQGWTEVPCGEAACQGQDGQYAAGCPAEGRFVDNGDGTVTDNCTGLMWQKDTADVNGDGQVSPGFDGGDSVPWCDALAYCEDLEFAGYDDWRLPNVRELESIVDYGTFNPAIDPVFRAFSVYWSSTSVADGPYDAWLVSLGRSLVSGLGLYFEDKGNVHSVRAVRSAP